MNRHREILLGTLVAISLAIASCGTPATPTATPTAVPQATEAPAPAALKACFFYSSPVNDQGWATANERGRQYVQENVPNVTTIYVDQIADTGGGDVERVLEDFVSQDCRVIVGTSFGYTEAIAAVAARHPDVVFINESQYKLGDNIQSHYIRFSDGFYLTGVVAGRMTQTNQIGIVATFPIPELVRRLNAFALGVQSVNADAIVNVVWTNSWYDPTKEKEAAESLIAVGADVIQHLSSSPSAVQAAEEAGVYSIGYQNDQKEFGPEGYLTSMMIEWGPLFAASIENVQNGTWQAGEKWFGVGDGVVGVGPYGPAVPDDVKSQVEQARADVISGDIKIFAGPIKDQAGETRIAAGEEWDDQQLLKIDWFVQGIEGSLPVP